MMAAGGRVNRCLPAVLLLICGVRATSVTPISKVLSMLGDLAAKGEAEKKAEAVTFAAFSQWCEGQDRVKVEEIAVGTATIEKLSAHIEKATADIQTLSDRIAELDEDVGRWHQDSRSATEVRDREAVDYQATTADYGESIDALNAAIAVLRKQAYDRPQAEAALLQVSKLAIPVSSKKALAAFLQQRGVDDDVFSADPTTLGHLNVAAPEANAYEFQSGGIVDMLSKLKTEFVSKKTDLDKEELGAKHAFSQILQQLTDNIEGAEQEIARRKLRLSETKQVKADAEGELVRTKSDQQEDQVYLDDMRGLCQQKTADFNSRQELRQGELIAIGKARDLIAGQAGAGEKYLPSLMQVHQGVASFVQMSDGQQNPLQDRIATFLADRAKECNSRVLSLVSQRVAADPFTKVKKLIKDLIIKLMEEATAETEHKGWCDTELTTNKQTRDQKVEALATLDSNIEQLTALIAQLQQEIADLNSGVLELDKAMAEMTAARTDSKAKNAETVQDAKDAQTAVTQAIAILRDFYAQSATATALAQQTQSPGEDAPETFSKPYQGMLPEGGSVVDFLEVILSDFSRLEAETVSAETAEEDEYKKFMFESEKDKALKNNDIGHKDSKRESSESSLHQANEERESTQTQLNKAVAYYEKLKPSCVDSGITYEERVARREKEVQSLQEALKILTGSDFSN